MLWILVILNSFVSARVSTHRRCRLAVRLRLVRLGKKKQPFYRIVVANSTSPRNGQALEIIGTYDPTKADVRLEFKKDRVLYWLSVGAQPSEPVRRLLGKAEILPKLIKTSKTSGISKKEKRAQAEGA